MQDEPVVAQLPLGAPEIPSAVSQLAGRVFRESAAVRHGPEPEGPISSVVSCAGTANSPGKIAMGSPNSSEAEAGKAMPGGTLLDDYA